MNELVDAARKVIETFDMKGGAHAVAEIHGRAPSTAPLVAHLFAIERLRAVLKQQHPAALTGAEAGRAEGTP